MYLSVDIGGTKTLIALFSPHGHIVFESKFPTDQSPSLFAKNLLTHLAPLADKPITRIVVAVPGIVEKNCTVSPHNLPNWHHVSIQRIIKNLFNCPIHVFNDSDLATIYETRRIRGTAVYLTFSTGIGGGIAKDGTLLDTSSTFEPGHWHYDLAGKEYEWEDLAAASAINRRLGQKVSDLTSSKSIETMAHYMSLGLNSIVAQYNPDTIIIGGPMALIFSSLKPHLIPYLIPHPSSKKLPRIIPAAKPEKSVIYGCYLYAKSQSK